ncbi:leucine-rich repeat neuronal protein 4 [Ahaetulla prasina]|uniref:leucine-rich repeat neuronal protein 4 n=1 Tax=Ahaetulla prasina TaxID=499056 RepID=UPI00264903E6|nr:leucine-rich repeat neuronal protein 4 [Ahaetulla prasina]XP_058037184.1 leucine-rich repeat neuronal protein 4 [Ahaetulla prasina]XP_058037194.1 leucine-rich repeat neuronal protein 4 [Ahaetulla prasina]
MTSFLACVVLLVRIITARPTEETSPAIPEDAKAPFLLIQQNVWEENINLTSLPCEVLRNQTSITLHVQNQNLTSFPKCLPELLESLDLSVNLLPELKSQDVAYLPKLRILSLRQNQIRKVIWGTGTLSHLQFLDLSFNLLSVVPSCITSSLDNLRWLSLAGNPIREIQPFAFSCYPQLHFLNLSSTWLGKDGEMGISESAFATNLSHHPKSTEEARKSPINVLDLSATFLERIHEDWLKELPQLTSFYLTQMPKLRRLDPVVFRNLPMLRELNCQESRALSLVETKSFHHIPLVASLIFKNCNLSNFSPWNLTSSHNLSINLYGNPLVCHCEISWLLSNPDTVILQRASDTMCYSSPGDKEASSSMLLSKLYDQCQAQTTMHSTLSLVQGKLYHTLNSITTEILADSSTLLQKSLSDSFIPQSTSFISRELTRKDPSKTDILAYKEQAVHRSTEHPLIIAPRITEFSTIPGKLSTEHPEDTTTPYQSTLHSFTTELTGTPYFEVSSDLFIPYSKTDSNENDLTLQDPTKPTSLPNLASTNSLPDYTDDYDYENQQVASVAQAMDLCDYDPCRHLQKPCVDLQKLSSCLCPGMSDEFTVPDPPRFHEVSEMRDTSAQIHWCSPNSAVRFYQLAYRPKGSKKNYTNSGEIYTTARQYTLYNLLPGSTYQVCIIAWNKAGSSRTTGWNEHNPPCSTFVTKSSYTSIFAALCATSGLFLIATILLSVCLCKKYKTPHIEQYNTHLVSYKNPAFDYSIK